MTKIYVRQIDIDLDTFFPCPVDQARRLYRYIATDNDERRKKESYQILLFFIIEKYQNNERLYENDYKELMRLYSSE